MSEQRQLHYTGTKLKEDVLALQAFRGTEQLSQLFQYTLEFISTERDIAFADVIDQEITVSLDLPDKPDQPDKRKRYFHGLINRFVQTAGDVDYAHYEATVIPKLWLLTRKADCRIYQRKDFPTIADVIFSVLERNEINFEKRLDLSQYREWEFCVQYRETDFNFISRLMEQEGIYYYFEHTDGAHKMILCDSPGGHKAFEGYESIPYGQGRTGLSGEGIYDWVMEKEVQTENFALGDFDFQKPTPLVQQAGNEGEFAHAGSEIFDYPGEYTDEHRDEYVNHTSFGERYARLRAQEMRAQAEVCRGAGDARGLATGYKFTMKGSPRGSEEVEYLVVSAAYTISTGAFEAGQEEAGETSFDCNLAAIEASVQYRPPRGTPKPAIQGPQTALVVGEGEIDTDKYGRVKVQFHWDREGKANRDSSCWVRVAQVWAGSKWGGMFIPRVGQEVIVEFLEGDPDRPIITGRVYNANAMPPYELPANATMSTVKSLTSKGGGGFNEIRFEDKKGSEQVFIHGEKNLDVRIKNDTYEWIGNDRHLIVKKDQIEHVENNRNEIVDADHMEEIGKDRHLKVTGKEAKEVGGSQSLSVTGDVIELFKANHSEQVANTYYLKGMNLVIEGMINLTLKVGGNFVVLDPTGVYINGMMVMINSGGAPGSGSPASVVPPAAAKAALEADKAKPGEGAAGKPHKPQKEKKSWIEIELVGEDDSPIPGETYRITLPDGSVATGTLDEKGFARVDGIDPGSCQITFPKLDQEAWEKA